MRQSVSVVLILVVILTIAGCDDSPTEEQTSSAKNACGVVRDVYADLSDGYPTPSYDQLQSTRRRLLIALAAAPDDVGEAGTVKYVRQAIEIGIDGVDELIDLRNSDRTLRPAEGVQQMVNDLDLAAFHCNNLDVTMPEPSDQWTEAIRR